MTSIYAHARQLSLVARHRTQEPLENDLSKNGAVSDLFEKILSLVVGCVLRQSVLRGVLLVSQVKLNNFIREVNQQQQSLRVAHANLCPNLRDIILI